MSWSVLHYSITYKERTYEAGTHYNYVCIVCISNLYFSNRKQNEIVCGFVDYLALMTSLFNTLAVKDYY